LIGIFLINETQRGSIRWWVLIIPFWGGKNLPDSESFKLAEKQQEA